MTLRKFYDYVNDSPEILVGYYVLIPLLVFILGLLRSSGSWNPKVVSVLLYGAAVPGIFSFFLYLYVTLFERRSILDSNLITEFLPIISLVITLLLIKKKYSFKELPGFGKIYGMFLMISSVFAIMFFIEKTRLMIFSMLPFKYIVIVFVITLIVIRLAWKKLNLP